MRIQNDAIRWYTPSSQRARSAAVSGQPDFRKNFDNYYSSLQGPNGGSLSNPMENAPQNVKDIWEKTKQEVGEDGTGVAPDGKLSHLMGYIVANLEQRFQTGNSDLFGSTIDSALTGAEKILARMNNPLSPPSGAGAAALQEKEKRFYEAFIANLSAAERTPSQTSPTALYEQMTGRTVALDSPSYDLTKEQIADLKSRYDVENISAKDYQALMKELADLGVVSKSEAGVIETTEGGTEFTSRPIILGLYPADVKEQYFDYKTFEGGDYLDWVQKLADRYRGGIAWLGSDANVYNNKETNDYNTNRLQKWIDGAERTARVLEQLK